MKTIRLPATEPSSIATAAEIIRSGGLVAYPTDTLYGLGADGLRADAVAGVFCAKGRPPDRPVPLLIADGTMLSALAVDIPIAAWRLAQAYWPGALTLVLKKAPAVPPIVSAGGASVAIRVPDHPVARALIRAAGTPLVGTSANMSGEPPPLTARDVLAQLNGRIDALLDGGRCPGGVESTVIDLTGERPRLLRSGAIPRDELEDVLELRLEL